MNRTEGFRRCITAALAGNHEEVTMESDSRSYQLLANPVTEDGLVAGVVLLLFDNTEKADREKLRREFTANVSHELKTPLTSISGFAEIMKNGMVKAEDVPRFANNIYDEAQRLISMVQDIIQLSRLDEAQETMEKTEVNVALIAETVAKRLEGQAAQRNIVFHIETESAVLSGVPHVLEEMIYNLCDNAIRYNKDNGSVTLKVEKHPDDITVTVADTGIGIPSSEQKKLFRNCFRGSNVVNLKVTGSGIGLMLVYKLVKLHKGKIHIQSVEHQGTCVQITFPKGNTHLHKAKFISPKTPNERMDAVVLGGTSDLPVLEAPQIKTSLQRILVVEDNDDLRNYLVDMLMAGYNIQSCSNGKDALVIIKEFNPDLVIPDIMMPEISGAELCSAIKTSVEMSHIPVILLTALGDEKNILGGLEIGADAYITKPFSVGILKVTIKNILANRELLRQVYNSIENKEKHLPVNCTNTLDWKFIASVKECIEKNMGDLDFGVDVLSNQHHMSRTSFYNKLKALTGYAPADYIRMIRLQRAAQLLKQKEYTITEIAEIVGFSDAKYFREVFKKYYNVSPSKFVNSDQE